MLFDSKILNPIAGTSSAVGFFASAIGTEIKHIRAVNKTKNFFIKPPSLNFILTIRTNYQTYAQVFP